MAERKRRQQDPRTPLPSEDIPPPLPRRTVPPLESAPPWLHAVRSRHQIDMIWLLVAGMMTGAGWMFFGWRALLAMATIVLTSMATWMLVGRGIRLWRPAHTTDSPVHQITLGLFLGLSLPVLQQPSAPILAGFLLGISSHLFGRVHRVRIHPVAWVLVLMWMGPRLSGGQSVFLPVYQPVNAVLRPQRIFIGDVLDFQDTPSRETWLTFQATPSGDAMLRIDPYEQLIHDQVTMLQPHSILMNMLTSGELAAMGELLFGSVPGPIGGTSRGLLLLLGLYLIYRRVASWPMALTAFMAAMVTLMLMPVKMPDGMSIVFIRLMNLDAQIAIVYVGYILLGAPLALMVFILAPVTAPMSSAGRFVYGVILGATLIMAQWIFQSTQAAYLSLLIASALSRQLDALHRSPFVRNMRDLQAGVK